MSSNTYGLTLDTKLLIQFKANGIKIEDAVLFFASIVRQMMLVKPNYGPHKNNAYKKYDYNTWIMRGWYPNSGIYFRLTLTEVNNPYSHKYIAKAIVPTTHSKIKQSFYEGSQLDALIDERAENAILGEGVIVHPVDVNKINLPKCISPKGLPVYGPPKLKK